MAMVGAGFGALSVKNSVMGTASSPADRQPSKSGTCVILWQRSTRETFLACRIASKAQENRPGATPLSMIDHLYGTAMGRSR